MSHNSSIEKTQNAGTLNTANHPLDLIIIGAGPIGISCAIQAKKKRTELLGPGKRVHDQFSIQLPIRHAVLFFL